MPTHDTETRTIEQRRHVLKTPWPKGASIGALEKMLARVRQELGDGYSEDAAWITPEDDKVVVTVETTKKTVPLGLTVTRERLEEWAGRRLTDEEVRQLSARLPGSEIPSTVANLIEKIGDDASRSRS